jgi:hypothetical protein
LRVAVKVYVVVKEVSSAVTKIVIVFAPAFKDKLPEAFPLVTETALTVIVAPAAAAVAVGVTVIEVVAFS